MGLGWHPIWNGSHNPAMFVSTTNQLRNAKNKWHLPWFFLMTTMFCWWKIPRRSELRRWCTEVSEASKSTRPMYKTSGVWNAKDSPKFGGFFSGFSRIFQHFQILLVGFSMGFSWCFPRFFLWTCPRCSRLKSWFSMFWVTFSCWPTASVPDILWCVQNFIEQRIPGDLPSSQTLFTKKMHRIVHWKYHM